MRFPLISFVFVATSAFGQYVWQSTTTVIPPTSGAWEYKDAGFWLGTNGANSGNEVRTALYLDSPSNQAFGYSTSMADWRHIQGYWENIDTAAGNWYEVRVTNWNGPWQVQISRVDNQYSTTQLATFTLSNAPQTGTIFSSSMRAADGANGEGAGINVRIGGETFYCRITGGNGYWKKSGFSIQNFYGTQFTDARVGNLDANAPYAVSGLSTSVSNGTLTATWNASGDDYYGIGYVRYEVLKGTQSLGFTGSTSWSMAVSPGDSFTFNVKSLQPRSGSWKNV